MEKSADLIAEAEVLLSRLVEQRRELISMANTGALTTTKVEGLILIERAITSLKNVIVQEQGNTALANLDRSR